MLARTHRNQWLILIAGFFVMAVISIYQYSWFLFAYALKTEMGLNVAAIGLTFTVFTYCATFIQPFSGYIADRYGPTIVAVAASVVVGVGFIACSFANTKLLLYVFYGLGGTGVGVLYGVSTACAVKWFPKKRGLATGMVVFGFGAGTAFFNWIIQILLSKMGLQGTFAYVGIFMLVVLVPLSFLYRFPKRGTTVSTTSSDKDSTSKKPREMLGTYQWYIIYFSFMITVSIVLIFGAQMRMVAEEFGVPNNYFQVVLFLFPLGNGLSRLIAGAVSDRIGRENTMVIFFSLLAVSIVAFIFFGHIPLFFIMIVFVVALLGGSPFALYPAIIGDYYGTEFSTSNYGITYSAKAWAGLISGWLSGFLAMKLGSYVYPFAIIAVFSLIAAVVSSPLVLKKPVR